VSKRIVRNSDGVEHELSGDELKVWDAIRWKLAQRFAEDLHLPLEEAEKNLNELREKGLAVIVYDEEKGAFRWEATELGKKVGKHLFGPRPPDSKN
jgi:hypothetical protein